jgi:nitrogen fixation/metabolism regulation signal transduction histidine kinase
MECFSSIKAEKLEYPKEFIDDVRLFNEGNFMVVRKFQDIQMRYLMLSDFYDYARLTKKYKKT